MPPSRKMFRRQTPKDTKHRALWKRRKPVRSGGLAGNAKNYERGESNGNRRNILLVRGTRRGAVTETIKVIAIKKSEFQSKKTNRLKSAIGS